MATRRAKAGAAVAAAVTAIPLIVSMLALTGRTWTPLGDEAVIAYRVSRVGGPDTPLVGVYSTRGWAHPGPFLYEILAPFRWLFGPDPTNLLLAATLINTAMVAVISMLLWRRRGLVGVLIGLVCVATLILGMGPELYTQIWNPYPPLLAYVALMLACWGVAEDDWKLLPAVVVLTSAVVQMHVGYLPLVVVALGVVAAWTFATHRATTVARERPTRRLLAGSVTAGVLLWVPALIDQFFGSGNLGRLAGYFTAGGELFFTVQPQGLLALIVLSVLLVAVTVTHRRRVGRWPVLMVLAATQLATGAVAASRLEEPVLSYLVVWMLPLACVCWAAVLLTAYDTVATLDLSRAKRSVAPAFSGGVMAIAVALLAVQTGRTTSVAGNPPLPRAYFADVVDSLAGQLDGLQGPVRVEGVGDEFNETWVGVVYALQANGVKFFTSDGASGEKWGSAHVWRGQHVRTVVTIATDDPGSSGDAVTACRATPGMQELAVWDELSSTERDRMIGLQIDNYMAKGKLPVAQRTELSRLEARGYRVAVFSGPEVCGTNAAPPGN